MTTGRRFFLTFWDLLLIQLANWRWSWAATVINGLITPITIFFFFKTISSSDSSEFNIYLLSGNIIVSLLFTTMYGTCARFAFMRSFGVLDYYATLPVFKPLLVLAVNVGFLLLTLPTTTLTLLLGQWLFNIDITVGIPFLLLVPLASFSLSAVGAFVGVVSPTFDTATSIIGILQFVFMGVGPVLVSADKLPDVVLWASYLLPSSYAADALRHSLTNQYGGNFWIDVAFLVIFDLAAMLFVAYKMEWRNG